MQYHTHVLEHTGNARWQLCTVEEHHKRKSGAQGPKDSQSRHPCN